MNEVRVATKPKRNHNSWLLGDIIILYSIYTVLGSSGSSTSRQISQWLQCSPPWLLMSGLSGYFFYYSVFSLLLSEASVTEILSKWLQDFNSLGNHWGSTCVTFINSWYYLSAYHREFYTYKLSIFCIISTCIVILEKRKVIQLPRHSFSKIGCMLRTSKRQKSWDLYSWDINLCLLNYVLLLLREEKWQTERGGGGRIEREAWGTITKNITTYPQFLVKWLLRSGRLASIKLTAAV